MPPLDINVVYSASKIRPRRRLDLPGRAAVPSRSLLLVGVLNLIAAGTLYYGTWWWVDPFLSVRFVMRAYLPGVDLDQAADIFGPRRPDLEESEPSPETELRPLLDARAVPKFTGQTGNIVMAATGYSWLMLATLASCALALASGTALGRTGGPSLRRAGLFLTLALAIALGLAGYAVWAKFGMQYLPNHLRAGMGGLVLLGALLGLTIRHGVRAWSRVASFVVILSAAGSAVALHFATLCGLITPEELPLDLYPLALLIFVLQSAWGWILLITAQRMGH